MTDLASRLDELGARLDYPPTPDLSSAVARRIETLHARRRRRGVLVALAVTAVVVGAVLAASPGARSALLRWLHIGGVRIERVEELPVVEVRQRPYFGNRVSLAEARGAVDFRVLLPNAGDLDEPDAVYLRALPPGGTVTLVYGSLARPRLALSQSRGAAIEPVLIKVLDPGTRVEHLTVDGARGVWLEGAPHLVVTVWNGREYWDTLYLAGSVLIWERAGLSFRLEAAISRDEAIRIAESVR
jgi:hypothetical protein